MALGVHHIPVPNIHEWDTKDVKMVLKSIKETKHLIYIDKVLMNGLPCFEMHFDGPVEHKVLYEVFDAIMYGGFLPPLGSLFQVSKKLVVRPYSSAMTQSSMTIPKGVRLELYDTLSAGEVVFIIRGGYYDDQYTMMTPDEYVEAVDDGAIEQLESGKVKKTDDSNKSQDSKSSSQAYKSIFAKSGSYARVSSDFPKFPKRKLMRAYMSVTQSKIDQMPPPPMEPGGEPSQAKPTPPPKAEPDEGAEGEEE